MVSVHGGAFGHDVTEACAQLIVLSFVQVESCPISESFLLDHLQLGRRHHNDGRQSVFRGSAHLLEDFDAIYLRHHQVQDDGVESLFAQRCQSRFAIGTVLHEIVLRQFQRIGTSVSEQVGFLPHRS